MRDLINVTNIPSSRVNIVDPKTGLISREWYRFFQNVFNLVGDGGNANSIVDLEIRPIPHEVCMSDVTDTLTALESSPVYENNLDLIELIGLLESLQSQPIPQLIDPLLAGLVQNGVLYINSAGSLENGSNFTFNSSELGVGTNPITGVKLTAGDITGGEIAVTTNEAGGSIISPLPAIYSFRGKNNNYLARIYSHDRSDDTDATILIFATHNGVSLTNQVEIDNLGNLYPSTDNSQSLGTATNRWSVVYAATGTINTSDEFLKTEICDISEIEKKVATELKQLIKKFKFKDSIAKKEKARFHIGVIAQEVEETFSKYGLNSDDYGIVCTESYYENGNEIKRLGIRYDELLAFIICSL